MEVFTLCKKHLYKTTANEWSNNGGISWPSVHHVQIQKEETPFNLLLIFIFHIAFYSPTEAMHHWWTFTTPHKILLQSQVHTATILEVKQNESNFQFHVMKWITSQQLKRRASWEYAGVSALTSACQHTFLWKTKYKSTYKSVPLTMYTLTYGVTKATRSIQELKKEVLLTYVALINQLMQ